jgi:Arc/MetJ-type ribon-helix-helix transcriptional regulator
MKSLTVRLPDELVEEIEAESRLRRVAKSEVVRERLQRPIDHASDPSVRLSLIADLIGSVEGLPSDMSARKKKYLKTTSYGNKRNR